MEVFLNHIVQLVIGPEHPIKDGVDRFHQDVQAQAQKGQGHAVDKAQPGADGKGVGGSQNQHHGTADRHTNQHLEAHLEVGHIGGQAGDNAGCGKLINIGKVEGLHVVVHVVAQVPGKAGGGVGRKKCRSHTKGQRTQGVQHQDQAVFDHSAHVAHFHTQVHDFGQDQGDFDLHINLAHHAQRTENGGPFVFPDTPEKSSYH